VRVWRWGPQLPVANGDLGTPPAADGWVLGANQGPSQPNTAGRGDFRWEPNLFYLFSSIK